LRARPRAVVVLTGSELVRGERVDANGAFLGRELTRLGVEPYRFLVVGDDPAELEAVFREAVRADLSVFSGGLGPTHDDRTIETLARVLGRSLTVLPKLEAEIATVSRRIAKRLGRPYADFAPGVRKQATVPAGGEPLGLAGTAPAVLVEHDGRVAVALPGPPNELRRLWSRFTESDALARALAGVQPPEHTILRFFGPSESGIAQALAEARAETSGLEITVCAHDLEIRVDLFAGEEDRARAARLSNVLQVRYRDELFARDDRPVAELVLERSRQKGWTLAAAESCTGGLVGARLTDVPGSSSVFLGSIVAYADDVKRRALGVPEELLRRHGAVSAEVAAAMAAGAQASLGADVAAAVTGIAGPEGGTREKPVGLVFIHAECPGGQAATNVIVPGDREAVRTRATALALHLLRRLLTQSDTDA
jgi:nicotinamide-nucleotide amidase